MRKAIQVNADLQSHAAVNPHIRLWRSVLADGVRSAKSGDARDLSWIDSSHKGPGTFEWVCDVLGYEPSFLRPKIHAYLSLGR